MRTLTIIAATAMLALTPAAQAREYPIGGPVQKYDMEIAANYLTGIEMAPMPRDMAMGPDVIHLEADVRATADNVHGFADGTWIPYLTVEYALEKTGSNWRAGGRLLPMTAKDGPHYANSVKMNGTGTYRVTFRFASPEASGFLRHVDKETGVPEWWPPFTEQFTFTYPQK